MFLIFKKQGWKKSGGIEDKVRFHASKEPAMSRIIEYLSTGELP